ncbi:hypothetical protein SO802_022087 [Lithocarpus litseifolius]|uniref:Sesquiterpene synthase n=1 Tax=Lithocarpus litseifolius TaxID=425828 RepID=A0AAW2CGY0_9ROSI
MDASTLFEADQASGKANYSTAVDIWSVGCIFAEMARRQALFPGDSEFQQLLHIFRLLGTPTEKQWGGVNTLRDWHAYPQWEPQNLARAVPSLGPDGVDILSDIHFRKVREVEELKDEVRNELFATGHLSQQLGLIDALQRLGVAYHFEREIQEALEHIYATFNDKIDVDDLYKVSLSFRLLRQEGFKVSCDVFKKFKDEDGQFKESLTSNDEGMLAFYEATHLRMHGEDILEEALEFTTTHLKSTASLIGNPLAAQITCALKQPLHKGIPRLEARRYISFYEQDASHNKVLLKLSILDFNLVQSLHKEELSYITRWWKDLDFATKLPFARDRIVECYFWIVLVYFEPQHSLARKILTRAISMTSILDDIYDAYGTLEELEPFTEAIERFIN